MQSRQLFIAVGVVAQLALILSVTLVLAWATSHLGGFAWNDAPNLQFNFHPVLMVLAFIFLYGNAILTYRVFRQFPKKYLKLAHGSLLALALIFAIIGLKAVWDSHDLNNPPIPNLYSLHSWIGLTTVLLFSSQYVCGFAMFAFPGLPWRASYLPEHTTWGIVIFCMAGVSVLTGLTEKAFFSLTDKTTPYSALPPAGKLVNAIGLSVTVAVISVVYLLTRPHWRRAEDTEHGDHLLRGNDSD